jgi:hypothetical protein
MAGVVLLHQPVRAVSAFDKPRTSENNPHSRLAIDAGSAVLPALKVKYVPHLCALSELLYGPFTRDYACPGPVVFSGCGASFQDKFPRWSSSTFM